MRACATRSACATSPARPRPGKAKAGKVALPSFKQYREADGKLLLQAGRRGRRNLLLQSRGFASPQEAGRAIARLRPSRAAAGDAGRAARARHRRQNGHAPP
jgi:tryptophanyl-tRNA synthetase